MRRQILICIILVLLLAGCDTTQPTYTDNGNPGQIKAVVFFDDNKNGVMDNGETGTPQRVAISQDISCTPADPEFVSTDANGEVLFKDLTPGRYCIFIDNGYGMTTKMQLQVYVSSDMVTVVPFGTLRE
jgi:hypothetical protein